MTAKVLIDNFMAADEYYASTPFYHGTSSDVKGQKILKSGVIRPGNVAKTRVQKAFEPLANRSYVSPSLRDGVIHALGGICMGHKDFCRIEGEYGWMFQVEPINFDVVVDEDELGEIAHDLLRYGDHYHGQPIPDYPHYQTKQLSNGTRHSLFVAIHNGLSPQQKQRAKQYDDYAHLTVAGKKLTTYLNAHNPNLLNSISKEIKSKLAVDGELKVVAAWRVHRDKTGDIKDDGSNFFEVAEQVK